MIFRLPLTGSKQRELMGDIEHVVEVLNPANAGELLTTMQARNEARRMFKADKSGAISRVNFIVIRADDERWLISFGKRGRMKMIWNFGNGRD